jgi:hypothetical protein
MQSPVLPSDLYPVDAAGLPTGDGPVDQTPQDHLYGAGAAPGLDPLAAIDDASPWRMADDGAVAATHWRPAKNMDGAPHLDVVTDMIGDGDSPASLQLLRTGVGQPNDPLARLAKRQKRWYERYINFHRFDVQPRPLVPHYAKPAQGVPVVPGRTQYESPFGNVVLEDVGVRDRFVAPLVRRQPGPWDEPISTDGAASTVAGVPGAYGLTRYGL